MANNKRNKNNRHSIGESDSFSDALFGNVAPLRTAGDQEQSEPIIPPEMSSQGDFFSSAYSENILASIAKASPLPKQPDHIIALPSSKSLPLLQDPYEQKRKKYSRIGLTLLSITVLFYLIGYGSYYNNNLSLETNVTPHPKDPFSSITLEAKAAYVYDMSSKKVLYQLNDKEVLPLASLTKLMTAVIASELLPPGTVITIGKDDITMEGDSGLFLNERWKLSDIIGLTLMTSSNDGASALATTAGSLGQNSYGMSTQEAKQKFVNEMNKKAQELGLIGTHFFNETGLDVDSEISGGYGSARDVAFLMRHVVEIAHKNIESTTLPRATIISLDNIRHRVTNTNEEIGAIPGIIASKTGYTDLAGGNLAIAFDAGLSHPLIIVVLGSTREGRFKDAENLSWAALKSIDR